MASSSELVHDYPNLFSPGSIGSLELRNRIVMTPMGTNQERSDGHLGEAIIRYYEERARGGVAMVIAGVASIMWPEGASNPNQAAISDDSFIADWGELATRVHAHGARVAVQLHHGSKVAVEDIAAGRPLWVPSKRPMKSGDLYDHLTPSELADATSALARPGARFSFHEMTHADIATVISRYAAAAERAKRSGLDGVELHAGHGYMLQAFLSPAANLRDDEYGGSVENRARMLVQTIYAVRDRVGADYPLWCRIDGAELGIENGISEEDARRTAEIAVDAGADAIHVSAYAEPTSAAAFTVAPLLHEVGGYLPMAAGVKARISVPVIAVGRIEPERGEQVLANGEADFIAMGRKLLADPELPNKLASGEGASARPCIYSYSCVGNVFLRRAARCTVNAWMGRESDERLDLRPAVDVRRIVVVGGGPTGLEAARVAAARGHEVSLYERCDRLGGLARVAAELSDDTRRWIDYLVRAVEAADIQVVLGTEIDADTLTGIAADATVVALGGFRRQPELDGAREDGAPRLVGLEGIPTLLEESPHGRRIAVVGDDLIALSLAEHFSSAGARVTLIGEGEHWAPEMSPPRRWRLLDRLAGSGARLMLQSRANKMHRGALLTCGEGVSEEIDVDTVVMVERAAPSPLVETLRDAVGELHVVGDANGPRYLQDGLLEAVRVAAAL